MLKCLIALTSLLSATVAAQTAYTWVDAQGRRHFSDTPVAGAAEIELESSQTFSAPAPRTAPEPRPAAEAARGPAAETPAGPSQAVTYTTFDIVSPEHEETLWNTGATLTLELAMYPALDPRHRIDAILDGERVAIGSQELLVTIPNVFRGEHSVQAVIVDGDGAVIRRSNELTVYIQQTSIQNPNNPNRPAARPSPALSRN